MRRLLALAATVAVGATALSMAPVGVSATVSHSPLFIVAPTDLAGNPASETLVASGYTPHTPVYVQQCNGKPSSAIGWSATADCDYGSSSAGVLADSTGTAIFPANDPNFGYTVTRGPNPQGQLFNCLSPNQAPINNGEPNYRNCQLRFTSNPADPAGTSDQQFTTIQLPDPQAGLCNNATLSLSSKAIMTLPAKKPKAVKAKGVGGVTGCSGPAITVPGKPKKGVTPMITIVSATMKLKTVTNGPQLCSNLTDAAFWATGGSIKITFLDGTAKKAAKATALIDGMTSSGGSTLGLVIHTAALGAPFAGEHLSFYLTSTASLASVQATCASTGLSSWSFSGSMGIA